MVQGSIYNRRDSCKSERYVDLLFMWLFLSSLCVAVDIPFLCTRPAGHMITCRGYMPTPAPHLTASLESAWTPGLCLPVIALTRVQGATLQFT